MIFLFLSILNLHYVFLTSGSSLGFFKYIIVTLFIRPQKCCMVSEPNSTNWFPPSMLSLTLRPWLFFTPCLCFLLRLFEVKHMQCEKSGVQKWKKVLRTVNGSTAKSDTTFHCFKRYRWIFDSLINILPGSAELLWSALQLADSKDQHWVSNVPATTEQIFWV